MAVLRSHRRVVVGVLIAAALVVAFAIGLREGGDEVRSPTTVPTLAEARAAVADAPPALARVYADGPRVLDLDGPAFRTWLRRLRGRPVVLNAWYPSCPPCREEFPILRRAAADYGSRVAFVGLVTQDSRAQVAAFLREQPTVYPHVWDRGARFATSLQAARSSPQTIVLDAQGRVATVLAGALPSLERFQQLLQTAVGVAPPTTTTTGGAR